MRVTIKSYGLYTDKQIRLIHRSMQLSSAIIAINNVSYRDKNYNKYLQSISYDSGNSNDDKDDYDNVYLYN